MASSHPSAWLTSREDEEAVSDRVAVASKIAEVGPGGDLDPTLVVVQLHAEHPAGTLVTLEHRGPTKPCIPGTPQGTGCSGSK